MKYYIFKNAIILSILLFSIKSNCFPNNISTHTDSEDDEAVLFKNKYIMEHENSYKSELDKNSKNLIERNYRNYILYTWPCIQHYTQPTADEYLIPLLNPTQKLIKYILLIKDKKKLYQIKPFGHLKLTSANAGWEISSCGNTAEALQQWQSRDPESEKWFRKPLNNGLGHFCVIRDDSHYLYTCYQFDKKDGKFHTIYGTYWSLEY